MTDRWGRVYEALQYTPWGETWVEQRRGPDVLPMYQFTGKELDPETNLYYYGARYYDPQTSVWQSTDPMLSEYIPKLGIQAEEIPGLGGGYNPKNMNLFMYTHANPMVMIDPEGRYVLQEGDTMSELGRKYGFTIEEGMKANPRIKDKNKIFAGENFNIPGDKPTGGYVDLNVTGGYIVGGTGGVLIERDYSYQYAYKYIGGGFTTPGIGGSITKSSDDIQVTPGLNIAVQFQFFIAFSFGYGGIAGNDKEKRGFFGEMGGGISWPTIGGVSITGFWVFEEPISKVEYSNKYGKDVWKTGFEQDIEDMYKF